MERIRLIEENQKIISELILSKLENRRMPRKNGKTSEVTYLIEKWLELEVEKEILLEKIKIEEKQRKENLKKKDVYATREELEKIIEELQKETNMSFEKVVTGFMYGKIKLKNKKIDVEHIFDIIEKHDGIK